MTDERREIVAIVRTYEDKETGKNKNVYAKVGTAWISEHGSKISLQIETIPVGNWNGKLYINKPYEPKDKMPLETVQDAIHDKLPDDKTAGEPINLDNVPF